MMPKKFNFKPDDFQANHSDENYAFWMRECFIYRLNQITGYTGEGESSATATDFFNAQLDVQKMRQRTTQVYHAMARQKGAKCPPLWTFGAAFHQHYVTEKNDYKKVLDYHQNKLFTTAERIYNKFLADQRKPEKKEETDAGQKAEGHEKETE
jgi:hypothetical protein